MSSRELAAIEAEAASNRAAFKLSAREIHRRLSRDYLVDLAIDRIAGDAASVAGEVVGQVKENGGKAALFGAGLLLAFGAGRGAHVSASDGNELPLSDCTASSTIKSPTKSSSRWSTVVGWAGGVGGAALAYAISNCVPVSETERELLGEVPIELKTLGADFLEEHLQGAKQLLAGSFGIASFAAGALGLMTAFAKLTRPAKRDDGNTGHASETPR